MSNINVGMANKGVLVAIVLGILLLGGGGGYLLWRVNQPDTVAPTDSDASGCTISRVSGDICRARGTGECNEDEAGAGTLCCKPYKKTCTYTLKYVAGTGGTIVGNATQVIVNEYITDGSLDKNTPEPSTVTATANSGYKFVKWSDGSTTAARKDEPKDATFTATFEQVAGTTYTVTYSMDPAGKGTFTGTNPQTVASGGDGTVIIFNSEGLVGSNCSVGFSYWTVDGVKDTVQATATRTEKNVTQNLAVVAKLGIGWDGSFKYTAGSHGKIKAGTGTESTAPIEFKFVKGQPCPTILPIQAVPDVGYKFSHWVDMSTNQRATILPVANPRTDTTAVVADFRQTISVSAVFVTSITCGDGTCSSSETISTCPADCPPSCGDGVCSSTESNATCPNDCTGGGTVPETGIFDDSKNTVIFGVIVLVIGLGWTWLSTLPQKAFFAISSTGSKMREENERKRTERRRSRLESRLK